MKTSMAQPVEAARRGGAASALPCGINGPAGHQRVKLPIIPAPADAKPFEVSGESLLELELEAAEQGNFDKTASAQTLDPPSIEPVTFKGNGLSPEFKDASWDKIREAIHG